MPIRTVINIPKLQEEMVKGGFVNLSVKMETDTNGSASSFRLHLPEEKGAKVPPQIIKKKMEDLALTAQRAVNALIGDRRIIKIEPVFSEKKQVSKNKSEELKNFVRVSFTEKYIDPKKRSTHDSYTGFKQYKK